MTDHSDLVERLRAACVGHPSSSIAWPHRILHEAIDALKSQCLSLSEARAERDELKKELLAAQGQADEHYHRLLDAQREIERLKKERDDAVSDLSSLRKGAEELDAALLESTAMRHSTGEHYSVEVFFTSFEGSERFRALLSARCARIRSALVSGSREDGDG